MSKVDEKAVVEAFRRHYKATGSMPDAWNKTLEEIAGPVGSPHTKAVADILRRVADRIVASLRGKVKHETVVLDVHPLDVWGNKRSGWDVNDVYPSRGSIELPIDATKQEIVLALKREGFIGRNIHHKNVEIDGEVEFGLDVTDLRDGKPAYKLRPRHGGGGARARRR